MKKNEPKDWKSNSGAITVSARIFRSSNITQTFKNVKLTILLIFQAICSRKNDIKSFLKV